MNEADIVVIGAGIAGTSVAAHLAVDADVILLEREDAPGYHATGRSAAYFAPAYGNAVVRRFTAMSEALFRNPPAGFTDVPFIRDRDVIFLGRTDQQRSLDAQAEEVDGLVRLEVAELIERIPILAPTYAAAGLLDDRGGDLDVDAILMAYLRRLRGHGGRLHTGAEVERLERTQGAWIVGTNQGDYRAPVVVNAAGAWADDIARCAGLTALGLIPKRRTALLVDPPEPIDIESWPLVVDVDESFYFKPDAGRLLVSPADESPSPPTDAQPDELDIAVAVDRLQRATTLTVARVYRPWAGLRTFAPDKTFVVGFDGRAEGFFWLAGQGGYGVQTAPALSEFAAGLVRGERGDATADLRAAVDPARLL